MYVSSDIYDYSTPHMSVVHVNIRKKKVDVDGKEEGISWLRSCRAVAWNRCLNGGSRTSSCLALFAIYTAVKLILQQHQNQIQNEKRK